MKVSRAQSETPRSARKRTPVPVTFAARSREIPLERAVLVSPSEVEALFSGAEAEVYVGRYRFAGGKISISGGAVTLRIERLFEPEGEVLR